MTVANSVANGRLGLIQFFIALIHAGRLA